MSLLHRLKFWRRVQTPANEFYPKRAQEIDDALEAIQINRFIDRGRDDPNHISNLDHIPVVIKPRGGVIKTKHKQYDPDQTAKGGKVVRIMPRQLRHMKAISEATDD